MTNGDDTEYLMSIPGMADKIKDGMNTPISECVPLADVWPDVSQNTSDDINE